MGSEFFQFLFSVQPVAKCHRGQVPLEYRFRPFTTKPR
jgi:hypothetical protein